MGIWTADNTSYLRILRGLLPRGVIWTRDVGRRLTKLLMGLADELVRVHNRAGQLMDEADPATTSELLEDWERVTGLPECPVYAPVTETDRRYAVYTKLSAQGGQSGDYFESIAAGIGADCIITDLYPIGWTHVMEAKTSEVARARCNSPCNSRLVEYTSLGQRLRCLLVKWKPAHTRIWWTE